MTLSHLDPIAIAHSDRLTQFIRSEIKNTSNQAITFARFMELALYAPGLGYYSAGSHKLGPGGDFVTAPELSPLFARCIAKQVGAILDLLGGHFLELGAGSGVFARDLMIQLKQDDCLPKHYFILEVSAELRERQQQLLLKTCPEFFSRFVWLETLPIHFEGLIFANEVLDALPVHCFRKEEFVWERSVTYKNNSFEWCLTKPGDFLQKSLSILENISALPIGYESEINLLAGRLIQTLVNSLEKGIILLFDYGYGRPEYYHPERNRGTLKCFYRHHHHDNPFINVGLQDITAHVDFTQIAEHGISAGARLMGYTTQSAFLLASGILQYAEENARNTVADYQQAQAIKTLTLPSQMGELIKVMGLAKNTDVALNGFEFIDRRRDL